MAHRWHNHADAAARSPPPNFPPESANPEPVFAASQECQAPSAPSPPYWVYRRIRPPPDRRTPPPSPPRSTVQNGNSSCPPWPRKRRDRQSPRKHSHPARRISHAAPPPDPSRQSHASSRAPHSIPRKADGPASAKQTAAPLPDPAPWQLPDKPRHTSHSNPRTPSCRHTVSDAAAALHTSSS